MFEYYFGFRPATSKLQPEGRIQCNAIPTVSSTKSSITLLLLLSSQKSGCKACRGKGLSVQHAKRSNSVMKLSALKGMGKALSLETADLD